MSISAAPPIVGAHALTANAHRRQKQAAAGRQLRGQREHDGRETSTGNAQLKRLDHAAAELGHELGPIRLAFGDALNALQQTHGHHELGFASLNTYASEHGGKPKRWIAESRTLATKLEHDSTLRRQLMSGRLTWTRAELLAKLVEHSLFLHDITNPEAARALRPALELSWFFRSSGLTCRELGAQLRSLGPIAPPVAVADGSRYLTLTIPSEDAEWFQAAERTFRRIAERTDLDAFLEALLAETHNTLHARAPSAHRDEDFDASERRRSQLDQRRTEAEHLCERARPKLARASRTAWQRSVRTWPHPQQLRTWPLAALHRHICTLAKQLHLNTAALGRSAEQLHRAQAWRRLGFASAGHYARDRLGVSLSSLKQKRALARRLLMLPQLACAVEEGQLGSVAASLVARVATTKTERRWVERARQRTVKHLREEVTFVERILRARPGHRGWPPAPEVMRAELALGVAVPRSQPCMRSGIEQHTTRAQPASEEHGLQHQQRNAAQQRRYRQEVQNYAIGTNAACSGEDTAALPSRGAVPQLHDSANQAPRSCDLSSGARNACLIGLRTGSAMPATTSTGQTSAYENPEKSPVACSCSCSSRTCTSAATNRRARHRRVMGDGLGLGRVRLRLRVHESTLLLYRDVARIFASEHPNRRLVRGLCEHFLSVWGPVVARKRQHKYAHIYERDGYQCTSPVCDRHDVTPHHLKFRSRGGGDEATNLTSLCVWCHLEGVHGGRLRADPQPDGIHWTIGRVAPLRVRDRDKQAPPSAALLETSAHCRP